jgi:hypothetical protein
VCHHRHESYGKHYQTRDCLATLLSDKGLSRHTPIRQGIVLPHSYQTRDCLAALLSDKGLSCRTPISQGIVLPHSYQTRDCLAALLSGKGLSCHTPIRQGIVLSNSYQTRDCLAAHLSDKGHRRDINVVRSNACRLQDQQVRDPIAQRSVKREEPPYRIQIDRPRS